MPNYLTWDEASAGGEDDLHPGVVQWFWRSAVTAKRTTSRTLLMQTDNPAAVGRWARWVEGDIHVVGAYIGHDMGIDDAKAVVQNTLGDSMPTGLTRQNLREVSEMMADGVPAWVVFDSEYMQTKWQREDEKRATAELEKHAREERRQKALQGTGFANWVPFSVLRTPPPACFRLGTRPPLIFGVGEW